MKLRGLIRSTASGVKGFPTPDALATALLGLGHFPLQLDARRLTAPARVRGFFEPYSKSPWLISLGVDRQLVLVLEQFWPAYLEEVGRRVGVGDCVAADKFITMIERLCRRVTVDDKGRWEIPTALSIPAGMGGIKCSVVLTPHRFWLEIFESDHWNQLLNQTLAGAQAHLMRRPSPSAS